MIVHYYQFSVAQLTISVGKCLEYFVIVSLHNYNNKHIAYIYHSLRDRGYNCDVRRPLVFKR